jgi:hypothetical protein
VWSVRVADNVFAVCFGRFETVVYRNINNKDKCLMDFCKEKINVFREATLFAKALMSARLEQTVCYTVGVFLSAVSLNTAFVSAR